MACWWPQTCGCGGCPECPCLDDSTRDHLKVVLSGFAGDECESQCTDLNGQTVYFTRITGCLWVQCSDPLSYDCSGNPSPPISKSIIWWSCGRVKLILGGVVYLSTSAIGCTATVSLLSTAINDNCEWPATLDISLLDEGESLPDACTTRPTCCGEAGAPDTLTLTLTLGAPCSTTYTVTLLQDGLVWKGLVFTDVCPGAGGEECSSADISFNYALATLFCTGTTVAGWTLVLTCSICACTGATAGILVNPTGTCDPVALTFTATAASFTLPWSCCVNIGSPEPCNNQTDFVDVTAVVTE